MKKGIRTYRFSVLRNSESRLIHPRCADARIRRGAEHVLVPLQLRPVTSGVQNLAAGEGPVGTWIVRINPKLSLRWPEAFIEPVGLAAAVIRIQWSATSEGPPCRFHIHICFANGKVPSFRVFATRIGGLGANDIFPEVLCEHLRRSVARVNSDPVAWIRIGFAAVVEIKENSSGAWFVFSSGPANAIGEVCRRRDGAVVQASIGINSVGTIIAHLARINVDNTISAERRRDWWR
jgi:hypothetical protein